MIIRHYRVLHALHESPRQPVTPAGWFWLAYAAAAAVVLWWLL